MKLKWKHTAALILALALLLPASRALAGVAAFTQIFTEATLKYHDGVSEQESKASVTVTVALVPAPAGLNEPADQVTVYADANTATNYSYTVTAGGNGPDDYTLDIAITDSDNASAFSAKIEGQSTPYAFRLGASVTTTGTSASTLKVPSDGEANSPGSVNGIEADDFIFVNGDVAQVLSVDDPATGVATIELKNALTGGDPGAGMPIYEQRSFDVKVTAGNIETAGDSITLLVKTSVTNSAGEVFDEVLNTFTSGAAVLTKFARNLTTAANNPASGGTNFTIDGSSANYYTEGLKAVKDDVIEYILHVQNAGTAPVTDCTIHDLLPSGDFVTFLTGVYGGRDFLYVDESNATTTLTAAADSDTATVSGADMNINVGTGADASTTGTIDVGKEIKVLYRLQVK